MSKTAQSSVKITFIIFISRILGLLRDHFFAKFFGTTLLASYWEIAFMFPNMLRNLLAEGVLSQSFVPLYSDSLKKSEEYAKRESGKIIIFLLIFFIFFVTVVLLSFPYILPFYVGKPREEIGILIDLSQILFSLIALISLASIFAGIAQTHQRFIISNLSSIVLNLVFILGFIFIGFFPLKTETIAILNAYVSLLGGFLILLLQWYYTKRNEWEPIYSLPDFNDPIIKKLISMVLPAILGASIFQLGQLIDILLASYLVKIEGAIPALRFAHRLIQLPTGLIGVAISTAILPTLTSYIREGQNPQKNGYELISALRFCLFLTIPASLGLYFLGPWIIHFLFSGGKWDLYSTSITWWSLQFYLVGIPFYSINKILVSSFYAYQDTKTPVRILLISVSLNIIMSVIFIPYLQHGGLALSSALSAILNSFLLFFSIKKHITEIPGNSLISFFKSTSILLIFFISYLYFLSQTYPFPVFSIYDSIPEIKVPERSDSFNVLLMGIGGGATIYFTLSYFFLKNEFKIILDLFTKFKR